jgi:hypothetical protein
MIGVAAAAANLPSAFSTPPNCENQRDKQQVGKRDLRELDCEPEPVRVVGKARRKAIHHPGHRDLQGRDEKQ